MTDPTDAGANKDHWSAVAKAWEEAADSTHKPWAITYRMLDALGAEPGETILELAAGTGDLGFAVADVIGQGGRLITTDFSAAMVQIAARRASDRGLTNVETMRVDAQRIPFDESSVDAVLCRFGLMLIPDQATAIAEIARVLRQGGRVVLATWAGPELNPWMAASGMALLMNGHPPDGPGPFDPGGVFSLSDPKVLSSLFAAAGFVSIEVEQVAEPWSFSSFEEFWHIPSKVSGPLAARLATLSKQDQEAVAATLRQLLEPHREGTGYLLPRAANLLSAQLGSL